MTMADEDKGGGWKGPDAKWTRKTGKHGYSVLPNILFWYTADLGITPSQQAVLFNLLSRWWEAGNPPVVSKARIAEGVGLNVRQVQRNLKALEEADLIETGYPDRPGRHPKEFTFNGLVSKLEDISDAYDREKKKQKRFREEAARKAAKSRIRK
jgi:hypothetical protein